MKINKIKKRKKPTKKQKLKVGYNTKFNVEVILKRAGKVIDRFLKHNVSTTVGKYHIADQLAEVHDEAEMGWMEIGSGADAGADPTALTTALSRLALTSRDQQAGASADEVLYQCVWAAGVGTGTVTEAGIFNASSAGIILCYVHFDSAIPKVADVELTLKWTATIS